MTEVSERFKEYYGKMNELKCNICNKYLSIPPILYHEAVGNVCGRCFKNGETKNFDGNIEFQFQDVFEVIAKYLKFPCSFDVNGCNQILKWGGADEHETNCEFQGVLCPLSLQEFSQNGDELCEWKGSPKELFLHMLDDLDGHEDIFTAELMLNIDPSKHFVSLIAISKILESNVLLMMQYKDKFERHFCNVWMDMPFVNSKFYKFDFEITGETGSRSIIFPNNSVLPNHHRIFSGQDLGNSLEIDIRSLYKLMGKPEKITLLCKIYKISENGKIVSTTKSKTKVETELTMMKCNGCGNHLVSPIYVCQGGHNNCSQCQSKSAVCGICNSNFLPGQNTVLETITSLSFFQCKNGVKGCPMKMESKQLDFHQSNCSLTEKNCVVNCGWKGCNADMHIHLKNTHSITYINQVYNYDSKTKLYPILFDDNIFILTLDFKLNTSLSINLQCLGMQEGQYGYEFTLISSHNNIKLVTHHLCQPLLYDQKGGEIQTPKIVLPFEFFRQFIADYQKFDFKINIKKN